MTGSILAITALTNKLAWGAFAHFPSQPVTTVLGLHKYLQVDWPGMPSGHTYLDMGDTFSDVFGHKHLICMYSAQHPFPDKVLDLHTVYFREIRTQGTLWVAMTDDHKEPVLFTDPDTMVNAAKWIMQQQDFWKAKFHSGNGHVNLPDNVDDRITVKSGASMEELIARMRSAP